MLPVILPPWGIFRKKEERGPVILAWENGIFVR